MTEHSTPIDNQMQPIQQVAILPHGDTMDFEQIRAVLKVSKNTLLKYLKTGELRSFYKIGGQWKASWTLHVRPYLEAQEQIAIEKANANARRKGAKKSA